MTPTADEVMKGEDLVVGDSMTGPSAESTLDGKRWRAVWDLDKDPPSVAVEAVA